jgi:hypothetical protein
VKPLKCIKTAIESIHAMLLYQRMTRKFGNVGKNNKNGLYSQNMLNVPNVTSVIQIYIGVQSAFTHKTASDVTLKHLSVIRSHQHAEMRIFSAQNNALKSHQRWKSSEAKTGLLTGHSTRLRHPIQLPLRPHSDAGAVTDRNAILLEKCWKTPLRFKTLEYCIVVYSTVGVVCDCALKKEGSGLMRHSV